MLTQFHCLNEMDRYVDRSWSLIECVLLYFNLLLSLTGFHTLIIQIFYKFVLSFVWQFLLKWKTFARRLYKLTSCLFILFFKTWTKSFYSLILFGNTQAVAPTNDSCLACTCMMPALFPLSYYIYSIASWLKSAIAYCTVRVWSVR